MDLQAEKIELVKMLLDTEDKDLIKSIKDLFKKKQSAWWDELPESVKEDINEAILQADWGELTPHSEVMKKFQKYL